ncbi:MAG: CbiX/SirB N-terminal domain-containing protein [Verrucomicrobiota bacterium]|jgi:sirohydrochlorin cobaltochelatase
MLAHSTLVLLGHGSTLNGQSSAPTRLHADTLRRRGVLGQVLEAYWKQEPSFAAVLRSAWHRDVFVVPLFISAGYFTQQVIPRELGLPLIEGVGSPGIYEVGRHRVRYGAPVGTHPSMTDVIARRAMEVLRNEAGPDGSPRPSEVSLFVAGHGTSNSENSRRAVEDHVALLAARGGFHDVHAVFMEESPRIEEVPALAQTRNVVVVPFFLSDGLHTQEDIPVLLGADPGEVRSRVRDGLHGWRNPQRMGDRTLWYTPAVGDEPGLADVILERALEWGDPCVERDDSTPSSARAGSSNA